MASGFEKLMPLFLSETERILKEMETACHTLLDTPDDTNLRDVICRGAHTIKGSAASRITPPSRTRIRRLSDMSPILPP